LTTAGVLYEGVRTADSTTEARPRIAGGGMATVFGSDVVARGPRDPSSDHVQVRDLVFGLREETAI
jgi:hypothetical protein